MGKEIRQYSLYVAPGVLCDGTFGVYIIADDTSSLEHQIASQLPTLEEAYLAATYFRHIFLVIENVAYITKEEILALVSNIPSGLDTEVVTTVLKNWDSKQYIWDKLFKLNQPNYAEIYQYKNIDAQIKIVQKRHIHLDNVYSSMDEKQLEDSIKEYYKESFSSLQVPKFKSWSSIPIVVAIVSMIVFYLNFSIKIPEAFPLVGEIFKETTLGPTDLAMLLPLGFLLLFIRLYFLRCLFSLNESAIMDQVLVLAINHGWTKMDFLKMIRNLLASGEKRWAFKLFQIKTDPLPEQLWDAAEDVIFPFVRKTTSDFQEGEMREFMNGLTQGYFGGLGYGSFEGYKMLLKTEFEKKIHALYFLKREKDFKPIHLAVNPVSFIILDSRSIFKDSNEVLRTHHSRISSLLIWIFIGQIIYFGPIIAALIWSLLVLAQSSMMISILIISWLVSALALAIPFYRVYKVLIRKRGWPRECFLYDSPSGILV